MHYVPLQESRQREGERKKKKKKKGDMQTSTEFTELRGEMGENCSEPNVKNDKKKVDRH